MRKAAVFSTAILFFMAFGLATAAEMAKEGSGNGKSYYHGTYKAIAMEKERVRLNYEVFSIGMGDSEDSIFHNTSGHCLGSLDAIKGKYENDGGFCESIRPDGDKIFLTYKASGQLGGVGKGSITIVGGTGKLVGIEGSGEFTRFSLRPPAEGNFASYSVSKITWKIP